LHVGRNSRAQWRQRLQKRRTQTKNIWVSIAKKERGLPTISNQDLVEEAVCLGWVDGVRNKMDDVRFKALV
jgi:uncharacterized protein YdeI (YjbR/CyaY-like superfamily)